MASLQSITRNPSLIRMNLEKVTRTLVAGFQSPRLEFQIRPREQQEIDEAVPARDDQAARRLPAHRHPDPGVIFTLMLASFPAGLVISRAWNNTLSVAQQSFIMSRHGAKIELWDNIKALFGKKKTS